ncbi:MAG: hypothetical protein LBN34_09225 [Clostridiales Family XIII bacterium]|jgi:hypothetical protein|nr:hypothetical protein [Clostridiales Family XIII bacterium]
MPLIILGLIVIVGALALILNSANTAYKKRKFVVEDVVKPIDPTLNKSATGKVINLFPNGDASGKSGDEDKKEE